MNFPSDEYLLDLVYIALCAGEAILDIYERDDHGIQTKADDSPVTLADLAAHQVILDGLQKLAPDIPILSEESDPVAYQERRSWQRYFLVDPLDGTKEFINRNGEFTVNIALIEDGEATKGVVHAPAKKLYYVGNKEANLAYVFRNGYRTTFSAKKPAQTPLTVVASRRHGGEALEACMAALRKEFAQVNTTSLGSSLKLCMVAEGQADLYPRLAPTSEWDTAAAQAVLEAAGGLVVDEQMQPLRYNTKEDLLNPSFYALGDKEYDWQSVLSLAR
ncbi:MAG: 3'(2'),5'-bisphosphate nucleotidase CysQ [Pseudomonadales bacterium]